MFQEQRERTPDETKAQAPLSWRSRPETHERWGLGICALHAVRFVGSE